MNKDKFRRVEALLSEARKNLNEAMKSEEVELEEFEAREAYLNEFDRLCDRFDIEVDVELEEDESKDDVYSEWNDHVNMSASKLKKWSKNPCSRQASKDPQAVIKRNLRLLERNKEDWTENDVEDAKRTISFISRMKAQQPDSPREGPHGCPSEWAISLLNWAFNPFDSVPTPSSEVKEDLEPVEEVNLSSELQERKNIKEAEMLAEQVWVLKDVMNQFADEFEEIALELETERSEEEVENLRQQTFDALQLMMTKVESPAEEVGVELQFEDDEVEMSESRKASRVVHGDQEKHLGVDSSEEDDSVDVPPVAIHKVESGSNVEVSEDVEDVLDELWEQNSE